VRSCGAALSPVRGPVVGCTWLPGPDGHASLCVYGPTWICTARPLTTLSRTSRKKRRSGHVVESDDAWSVRTTFRYQPLLYAGVLPSPSGSELLVIERPYFALAPTLPPAFYRGAKYGM